MPAETVLELLQTHLRPIAHLNSAASLLSWDQETYMPAGGGEARAEQIATLHGLAHARLTAEDTATLLHRWIDPSTGRALTNPDDTLSSALLRETWRDYIKAKELPNEFVRRLSRTCSLAQQVWAQAKTQNDFGAFLPHLKEIISLKKEEAAHRGASSNPYDALLDLYEPGATAAQLTELFDQLKSALLPLLSRILESPRQPPEIVVQQGYDTDRQLALGRTILTAMGYDFNRGRLDVSAHPFTTSFHPTDVRVTTRVSQHNFTGSLFSCIHEGGHGLYDQGLPSQYYGTPLAEAISLGIHESQSRLWENCVGRSRAFWRHFFPLLQKSFPLETKGLSLDRLYAALNTVQPSCIRVEADELTYNLHILLRFELERDMINDSVPAEALPELWRDKMRTYLGIVPSTDRDGVLQDVHWSIGAIGYFPTYTLGNVYAAQFFAQASRDLPQLTEHIARGDLLCLTQWLHDKIHRWGRMYTADELVRQVTGAPLTLTFFVQYLEQKYAEIYGLQKETA
jgi:carboxypeptidase Taq